MSDATSALIRAITVNFVNFTPVFEAVRSRDWASGTFVGTRHKLTFRIEGEGCREAAKAFAGSVDGAEFQLRGHILADIALISRECAEGPLARLSIEALTVEDS